MVKYEVKENIKPVSTMVGVSPAVRVFDSIKVIFPGMSMSKRCIYCYTRIAETVNSK